ncbi:NAD-dependent epimerase/dehydratase family protein [Fictibacillus phosphorivorans]|uniref:NAD-dependent epimerase/dehydratase family protein n=1 Tax=Fictibacillus phosphorivorans TaxID=1221500 RepID=UPI0012936C24|nr:NAD-dependent epimerase/dehydratase family protein [Fictibacillus phosphorivorans]MQR96723.1 NAD-dependent epimerase/dehydratase family protein [Fictibacillus phosphorivorans]
MKKKILITGAAGFTGIHACKYFADKGYDVIGISRSDLPEVKVRVVTCDLLDKEKVSEIFNIYKPDFCLHLAGVNSVPRSWNDPSSTIEANVLGTVYLLEAIRKAVPSCRTVIVSSALSGIDHPYGVSKKHQEQLVADWANLFDLQLMIAKPCNLIGPGRSPGFVSFLANRIIQLESSGDHSPINISHLQNEREFLDVRDAIAAYEVLLKAGNWNVTYEIGSGKMTTLLEILNIFQTLTKEKLTIIETNDNKDLSPRVMNSELIKDYNWQTVYPLELSIKEILSYHRLVGS